MHDCHKVDVLILQWANSNDDLVVLKKLLSRLVVDPFDLQWLHPSGRKLFDHLGDGCIHVTANVVLRGGQNKKPEFEPFREWRDELRRPNVALAIDLWNVCKDHHDNEN